MIMHIFNIYYNIANSVYTRDATFVMMRRASPMILTRGCTPLRKRVDTPFNQIFVS